MKRPALVLVPALLVTAFTYPEWKAPTTTADEAAIRATVENYFNGMMRGQPALLEEAFHSESRLMAANQEGGLMILPFDRWAASWDGRPALDAANHQNRILDIDIHGAAAVAKTELVWPNVRYVDYLSLVRVGEEWKIVNKIWDQESR